MYENVFNIFKLIITELSLIIYVLFPSPPNLNRAGKERYLTYYKVSILRDSKDYEMSTKYRSVKTFVVL